MSTTTSDVAAALAPLGAATKIEECDYHWSPVVELTLLLHKSIPLLPKPKPRCAGMTRYMSATAGGILETIKFATTPKEVWVGKGKHRRKTVATLDLVVMLFDDWQGECERFAEYAKEGVYVVR